jgi:hypothetical protein
VGKYLYGASVQGIQEFIFKTNQLQEIVGASEIVKSIDTMINAYHPHEILMQAAGNIKAIFDDKEKLEKVVREFPKKIMQKAYGITISQAVVDMEKPKFNTQEKAIKELEKKLKTQRNKPSIPLDISINIMELAPKTARPIVKYRTIKKELVPVDMATDLKLKANEEFYKKNPQVREFRDLSELSNGKNKLAVIHADGNGLGAIVPKLGDKLSSFSTKLNDATQNAFKNAKTKEMKIREIILGGDDLTVICDANFALEFTKNFLDNFEKETSEIQELKDIGFTKLTACAGIAYCNEKYPFHYAESLAEALCSATKKHAKAINKDLAPSSLMFHNIQSSNFQSWDKFVDDELTIISPTNNKAEIIRCDFGPYYLSQNGEPQISNFLNTVEAYRCDGSPISRLRSWMSELSKSNQSATNMLDRINDIIKENKKWNCKIMENNLEKLYKGLSNEKLIIDDKNDSRYNKTPIYDVLQILSVTEAN